MKAGDIVTVKERPGSYIGKDWRGELIKIEHNIAYVRMLSKKSDFHGQTFVKLLRNIERQK